MGRLTKDPEVKYLQNENSTAMARYTLAVDRRYRKDGKAETDFISCVTFGKNAEFAEKYLKNCITSVVGQTYRNLEIILVDDGSNDNSLSICEKFALQDNRIKVFHQNNGGVASARNKGLSEASGEFIAWVDSDDSIEPEYIEKLYDAVSLLYSWK